MAEDSITLKKSTVQIAAVFVVALVIGYFLGGYVINPKGTTTVTGGNNPPPGADGTAPSRVQVSADDDPTMGSKDAKVVMIEFSDFQCPFCGRFFSQTLPQIEKDYIDTGKVLFVYRDFPLSSIHPNAQKAAEAAECAEEQGKWRGMHDMLFNNQDSWAGLDNAGAVSKFKEYVKSLGANEQQFDSCLDSGKYQEEVQKDFSDGANAGVGGTPTFFINGIEVSGAQPFSVFKQIIDQELAK
ncbi:MAG: DsbA family protein [Candidatus Aenigmarchaeota archaeon]|nr:DsbA family protein [Candidatus Aenigmarchaeota archaeon]